MLDQVELDKYFTKEQQQDVVELERLCASVPITRLRRPRVRKVKPDHIPRPVNSFMTFRAEKQSLIRKFCTFANHRDISKIVASWWHKMDSDQKAEYVMKATAAKAEHAKKYPDYVFKPKSKKQKKRVVQEKRIQFKETPPKSNDTFTQDIVTVEEIPDIGTSNSAIPSNSMYDDLDWSLSYTGGCQYFYNHFDKLNPIPTVFPTAEDIQFFSSITPVSQSLETPLLDYSQSPLLPEESFRPYVDYCFTNGAGGSMIIPPLDNGLSLGYPYDGVSLDNTRY